MGMTGGDSDMGHLGQDRAIASDEATTTAAGLTGSTTTTTSTPMESSRPGTERITRPRTNGFGMRQSTATTAVPEGPEHQVAAPGRSRAKRGLDILLTLAALPVAGLIGLAIAVLVRISSRGPVFFLQKRVGLGGTTFRMVKFRTMQIDAEERLRADPELWNTYVDNDFKLPAESDPRLTRVGRWMRRWSLDELPQILNVLTGSMSWVGPRPVTPDQLEDWGPGSDAYLSVRPGITGWWQINGRSDVQSMDRIAYDRDYAESWTFWLDVRILARTPVKVIHGKGAF